MPKLTKLTAYLKTENPPDDKDADFDYLVSSYCPHEPATFTTIYINEDKIPTELKHQWQQLKMDLAEMLSLYAVFICIARYNEPTNE